MAILSALKGALFLLFFSAVAYFTYQGFDQVLKKQTSTRAEYRFGDDDDGNLELFDITACVSYRPSFVHLVAKGANLSELIEASENGIDFASLTKIIQFEILASDSRNLTYNSVVENPVWTPKWNHVLDWERGHCYTFSPKDQGISKAPIISHNTYDNSQIQMFIFNGPKVGSVLQMYFSSFILVFVVRQLKSAPHQNKSTCNTFLIF